jgi:hypothetical protein
MKSANKYKDTLIGLEFSLFPLKNMREEGIIF